MQIPSVVYCLAFCRCHLLYSEILCFADTICCVLSCILQMPSVVYCLAFCAWIHCSSLLASSVVNLNAPTSVAGAANLSIRTQPTSDHQQELGSDVVLDCEVVGSNFSPFFNQIIWYKTALDGSLVQINTMSIITNDHFKDTGRYAIGLDNNLSSEDDPSIALPLSISGACNTYYGHVLMLHERNPVMSVHLGFLLLNSGSVVVFIAACGLQVHSPGGVS